MQDPDGAEGKNRKKKIPCLYTHLEAQSRKGKQLDSFLLNFVLEIFKPANATEIKRIYIYQKCKYM